MVPLYKRLTCRGGLHGMNRQRQPQKLHALLKDHISDALLKWAIITVYAVSRLA